MSETPPFPFIVGCGRSGTTLLRAMVDAHPEIAVPFESYFPVWFARRRSRYEKPGGFAASAFAEDVLTHDSVRRWGLDPHAVHDALCAAPPSDYPDAIRRLYALYASTRGKPRYADKTPIFIMHMPLLASLLPEAVFIHIVRDGRDVVLSRSEAAWGTDRADFELLVWRSQVEHGRDTGRRIGAHRYREVRYEDLLDDTEPVLRDLCDFIDVPFDAQMLSYHERASHVIADQPHPEEHQNVARPPTKGLRDWRRELSKERVALFHELAGETLTSFGYTECATTSSTRVRAEAIRARARYVSIMQYRRTRTAVWRAIHRNGES